MSDIRFSCPKCQRHLQGDPGYAGRQITCPSCGTPFVVPSQAPVPRATAAPTAAPVAATTAAPRPVAAVPVATPVATVVPVAVAAPAPVAAPATAYSPNVSDRLATIASSRVKKPAIALLITGILWVLYAGFALVNYLVNKPTAASVQAVQGQANGLNASQLQTFQNIMAVAGPLMLVIIVVSLAAGVVVLLGAIKMKKLESRGLAMTASILAMLPVSPCCVLGLPFGIWALMALSKPEVKAAFH